MQPGKYNVRLPRLGARIKVIPQGFDREWFGICVGYGENQIILDRDTHGLLSDESFRYQKISILENYVII